MPTVNTKTKVVTSMLNMFYLDVGKSTTPGFWSFQNNNNNNDNNFQ